MYETGYEMRLPRIFERALQTYVRTDGRTDEPTDGRSYRDASARVKTFHYMTTHNLKRLYPVFSPVVKTQESEEEVRVLKIHLPPKEKEEIRKETESGLLKRRKNELDCAEVRKIKEE